MKGLCFAKKYEDGNEAIVTGTTALLDARARERVETSSRG